MQIQIYECKYRNENKLKIKAEIQIFTIQSNHKVSTPQASKVHCSINGLKNSSSPEYSKVQKFFGIAVADFTVGGELLTLE